MSVESARPIASISASRVRASATAQESLDFAEGLLDGVEVRGVGWQVDQLAARSSMNSLNPSPLWAERLSITTICPGSKRRGRGPPSR